MSGSKQLSGFYDRQAFRCRLLARHSIGTQAEALNNLAAEYEQAAIDTGAGGLPFKQVTSLSHRPLSSVS